MTDNRNRTVSEIRHILERHNGKLGASNSVAWMFHRKGVISLGRSKFGQDALMELALDAGADDRRTEEDSYEITTSPEAFIPVKEALEGKGIVPDSAEVQLIPENTVQVEARDAEQVLKLMEVLEEHDDVQHVYANFDIDDKVLASFNG